MPNNYPEAVREIAERIAIEAVETIPSGAYNDDHVLILCDAEKIIADGTRDLISALESSQRLLCNNGCAPPLHSLGCRMRTELLSKWSAPSEEEK